MKILLINPGRSFSGYNIWRVVNSITPPLGLALLAALLESDGHSVDMLDAYAEGLQPDDVLARIDSSVDLVGISAMTVEIDDVRILTGRIRKQNPNIRIVLGGVHPTVFHKELLEEGVCDLVVRREGETAIRAIARGDSLETIRNLSWRALDGQVAINPESDDVVDLDALPFPAYEKLPMNRYHSALGAARRAPSMGMVTSRGCPGNCTFCYSKMFGLRVRFTSAERVVEHIRYVKERYGVREISFYDDTFTANKLRVKKICALLLDQSIDISWSCFARVDSVDEELLRLMKQAGCHQVMYGFETPNEDVIRLIGKRIKTECYEDVIQMTRRAGLDIRGAFMLGSPGETLETMRKTIEYSKRIGIQFAVYNITTPYPGTEMFRWAEENNSLLCKDWRCYDLAHAILRLEGASSEEVEECYKKAYREFYFRPSYILEQLVRLRRLDDLMTYGRVFKGLLRGFLR